MSYNSPTIQNGRIHAAHRRNTYFNGRLYRVSELVQHPKRITFHEFCILIWLVYALFGGLVCVRNIVILLGNVDVDRLCGTGQSFYSCCWTVAWMTFDILCAWLGYVVPWAFVCVAVIFLGEVVMSAT